MHVQIGSIWVDVLGLSVLGGVLLACAVYLLWCCSVKKSLQADGPVSAGMFRLAAARGDLHTMECLHAAAGLDIDAGRDGFTALHAAAVQGQQDAAVWLCAHGASSNAQKQDGWSDTALHYAAAKGHGDVARLLLAFGANPAAQNFAGATPSDLAAKSNHVQLAAYLKAAGAGMEPRPDPEPFLHRTHQLDQALQAYTDRVAAAMEELMSAQGAAKGSRGWHCSSSSSSSTCRKHPHAVQEAHAAVLQLLPSLLKPCTGQHRPPYLPTAATATRQTSHAAATQKNPTASEGGLCAELLPTSTQRPVAEAAEEGFPQSSPQLPASRTASPADAAAEAALSVAATATAAAAHLAAFVEPAAGVPLQGDCLFVVCDSDSDGGSDSGDTTLPAVLATGAACAAAAAAAADDSWVTGALAAGCVTLPRTSDVQAAPGMGMQGAQRCSSNSSSTHASDKHHHQPQQRRRQQHLSALQPLMTNSRLRGWEGEGSQGTRLAPTTLWNRRLACLTQVLSGTYLVWRAARSCPSGWLYLYSIPVLLAEITMSCMAHLFVLGMWSQLERPARWLADMLPLDSFPTVDVFVVCYNEPVDVVEPTCIAALNLNYPGSRLTVHVLDDGNSSAVRDMVKRLQSQARYMLREASIVYVARDKVRGVPHHAKAGNINSALLKAPSCGDFVLVLDCDMVLHPDFLMRTLGHFYWQPDGQGTTCPQGFHSSTCPQGLPGSTLGSVKGPSRPTGAAQPAAAVEAPWVLKEKAAFIQTPQDFWNVAADDPLVHFARFFYGPMLQGRDGVGAAPCCGTGVVFRRDVLVSIGGQAYGSITEDYNTAMSLLASGFSTMFLNERMVFGQAPDDLLGVFAQRLRWAMGSLQILLRDNPLTRPGLTLAQSLLFWEAAAQYFLAVPTVMMSVLPIIYIFTGVAPVSADNLWEFCAFFCSFYTCNRLLMWHMHRSCEGGDQEMWRGSQVWVWMAPNHCKAIWKVLLSEVPWLRWLTRKKEITFKVTQKASACPPAVTTAAPGTPSAGQATVSQQCLAAWRCSAPYLIYYGAVAASLVWVAVHAAMGAYTIWRGALAAAALGWTVLVCLCIWPPVATLLPREETEQGWRVRWDRFLKVPEPLKHAGSSTMSLLSYISHHGCASRRQSAYGTSTESSLASPVSQMRPGIRETPTAAGVARMRQPHGSPATALSRLGNSGAAATVLGSQHVNTTALSQGGGVAPMSATPGGPWHQHGHHSALGREFRDSQPAGFSLAPGVAQQCLLPLTGQHDFDASLPALSQVTKGPLDCSNAAMTEAQHIARSMSLGQEVRASHTSQGHNAMMQMTGTTISGHPLPAAAAAGPTSYHPGMVSLPGHTQLVRSASALLTGLVLPERPAYHAAGARHTGNHSAGVETAVPSSRAQTLCRAHHLGVGFSTGPDGCSLLSTTAAHAYSSISNAAGALCGKDSTSFTQGRLGLWPPFNVDMTACLPVQGMPSAATFEDHSTGHASQGPLLVVRPDGEVGPCPRTLALSYTAWRRSSSSNGRGVTRTSRSSMGYGSNTLGTQASTDAEAAPRSCSSSCRVGHPAPAVLPSGDATSSCVAADAAAAGGPGAEGSVAESSGSSPAWQFTAGYLAEQAEWRDLGARLQGDLVTAAGTATIHAGGAACQGVLPPPAAGVGQAYRVGANNSPAASLQQQPALVRAVCRGGPLTPGARKAAAFSSGHEAPVASHHLPLPPQHQQLQLQEQQHQAHRQLHHQHHLAMLPTVEESKSLRLLQLPGHTQVTSPAPAAHVVPPTCPTTAASRGTQHILSGTEAPPSCAHPQDEQGLRMLDDLGVLVLGEADSTYAQLVQPSGPFLQGWANAGGVTAGQAGAPSSAAAAAAARADRQSVGTLAQFLALSSLQHPEDPVTDHDGYTTSQCGGTISTARSSSGAARHLVGRNNMQNGAASDAVSPLLAHSSSCGVSWPGSAAIITGDPVEGRHPVQVASLCSAVSAVASAVAPGAAVVVPTEPATIFEASLAARPNFDDRQPPPASYWYQAVSAVILGVLLAGTAVELTTGKHL